MTKFNHYAKKVDEIAREAFEGLIIAEAAYRDAEKKHTEYKAPTYGRMNYELAAESARSEANLMEAKEALKRAKESMYKYMEQIREVRKELEKDIDNHFAVDPEKLDNSVLELLKSGILKPNDYERLFDSAQKDDNSTMMRLISKYASEAAEEAESKFGVSDPETIKLRAIVNRGQTFTASNFMRNFDVLTDVFDRCTRNTSMINHWDELTSDTVENF